MSEELQLLKMVTGRLDATGIPYMLTGSMALNYYAVPRMTRDIDLVVELSMADIDRVYSVFREDFYVEPETVRRSVERQGTFNVIHTQLLVKVDLVVRKDTEYRRTEFTRRRRVSLEGHPFIWSTGRLGSASRRCIGRFRSDRHPTRAGREVPRDAARALRGGAPDDGGIDVRHGTRPRRRLRAGG